MFDRSGGEGQSSRRLTEVDVAALAKKALSVLASRVSKSPAALRATRVREFCDALVSRDSTDSHAFIARMVATGVSTDDLLSDYIPQAARLLGEKWVEDRLSFADVTIGASRLQEIARALGGRYTSNGSTIPLGHSVLIVVPTFEQHTLGAFVAAGQLRRRGLWAHLAIAMDADEVARLVEGGAFSLIGFSISSERSAEPLRATVSRLREVCDAPIALGGAVAERDDAPHLKDVCGVDIVSKSPSAVLNHCNIGSAAYTGPATLDC